MQFRYDEDFIEAAVFLCASGRRRGVPSLQINRFHRDREKLYSILDPDERNTAFFRLHLEWFREWGLDLPLTVTLKEFPLVAEQLAVLAVRKTTGKSDEGAELYVNQSRQRTGLLALRPERIVNDTGLHDYLRHEFTHLHDMLDPAFGYLPTLDLPGLNPAQKRLARERYSLLWDITIDGRLGASGRKPLTTREKHSEVFSRAYSFWSEQKAMDAFALLWQCPAPRHADLLALVSDPRGLRGVHRPEPGGSCPLCDFPTFHWAEPSAVTHSIIDRIRAEFPTWEPEQSLCGRCLETYEAVAFQESATVG